MHSCVYEGTVQHRRFLQKDHSFQNRLFLMYLDLDELSTVFKGRWLWSASRMAVARFRRKDHVGDAGQPLQDCVRDLVERQADFRPSGPIRLLTSLRYFGYIMNPVCFYYCYADDGQTLEAMVAEVTNTPWGERHCYVIDARSAAAKQVIQAEHKKKFHVSPFMPMDMSYLWQISPPGQRIAVHIENRRNAVRAFDATLALTRREITGLNLARALVRFPWMTGQISASIYWQALRLWLKRVTFFAHPAKQRISAIESESQLSAPTNPGIQK
jgi:uncharacterized protein